MNTERKGNEMKLETIKEIYSNEKIEEIAREAAENIGNWSMELWADIEGNHGIRQQGSFAEWEDEVLFTMPLDDVYWSDPLYEYTDKDGNIDTENFIYYLINDIEYRAESRIRERENNEIY
jgi:hypothetical protein